MENEPTAENKPELELAFRGVIISISEGQMTPSQAQEMINSWERPERPPLGQTAKEVRDGLFRCIQEGKITSEQAVQLYHDWLTGTEP